MKIKNKFLINILLSSLWCTFILGTGDFWKYEDECALLKIQCSFLNESSISLDECKKEADRMGGNAFNHR